LRDFALVNSEELEQCEEALSIIDEMALLSPRGYQQYVNNATQEVFEEFESWARRLLEQQTDKHSRLRTS
jgi:hypothetical protein